MHVVDQGHQPVVGEATEIAVHDTFRGAYGSGDGTCLGTWVGRDVGEYRQVLAMSALHQVLAE
ncbi:hypothetical protein [Streptomyces sp. NPDC002790]|uniref:hypothetical protein n=1 Tax=Streptomyces sp. NPDC002790 TaxID=3154431 RepID=UPI00331D8A01